MNQWWLVYRRIYASLGLNELIQKFGFYSEFWPQKFHTLYPSSVRFVVANGGHRFGIHAISVPDQSRHRWGMALYVLNEMFDNHIPANSNCLVTGISGLSLFWFQKYNFIFQICFSFCLYGTEYKGLASMRNSGHMHFIRHLCTLL